MCCGNVMNRRAKRTAGTGDLSEGTERFGERSEEKHCEQNEVIDNFREKCLNFLIDFLNLQK